MKEAGGEGYINVTIPGSVYSALLENEMIENPYYRDNENEALNYFFITIGVYLKCLSFVFNFHH